MMNNVTIEKLQSLKLFGMADELERQLTTPMANELAFEHRVRNMVDHELTFRDHTLDPLQTDEGLINGVNLLSRPETGGHTHHPIADVTVQREVGRQGNHPGFFGQMPDLKPGCSHLDAQGLGLIAAGDGTTVIVGQDDQGPAVETGSKHPLTAAVEVVAIDQGEHSRPRRRTA